MLVARANVCKEKIIHNHLDVAMTDLNVLLNQGMSNIYLLQCIAERLVMHDHWAQAAQRVLQLTGPSSSVRGSRYCHLRREEYRPPQGTACTPTRRTLRRDQHEAEGYQHDPVLCPPAELRKHCCETGLGPAKEDLWHY